MLYTDDFCIYIYCPDLFSRLVCRAASFTLPMVYLKVSQTYLPKTVLLITFTNSVPPKNLIPQTKLLESSLSPLFSNIPSSNQQILLSPPLKCVQDLAISHHPLVLLQHEPPPRLSWFAVLASYFVSLLQSLAPHGLFSNIHVECFC